VKEEGRSQNTQANGFHTQRGTCGKEALVGGGGKVGGEWNTGDNMDRKSEFSGPAGRAEPQLEGKKGKVKKRDAFHWQEQGGLVWKEPYWHETFV